MHDDFKNRISEIQSLINKLDKDMNIHFENSEQNPNIPMFSVRVKKEIDKSYVFAKVALFKSKMEARILRVKDLR